MSRLVDAARAALRGARALAELHRAGGLTPGTRWVALTGAGRYLSAVLAGDVCDDDETRRRLGVCAACPHATPLPGGPPATVLPGYCGPALVDRTDQPEPTCGCLLQAKASVASESCPQERWGSAPRHPAPTTTAAHGTPA